MMITVTETEGVTLLITDPWSKGNYSRVIREASMVERRLSEVGPPSGRMPGRGLLVLPISEARRRRNRGEITKKGSVLEGFASWRIYRRRGAARGGPGAPGGPLARPGVGPRRVAAWAPCLPYGPSRALREASSALIFYLNFPGFWSTFYTGEN